VLAHILCCTAERVLLVKALHGPPRPPQRLLQRVRAEFLEMPGLRLTRAQARRLWALDEALCDAILTALVDARFLVYSGNVAFMRAD